MLAQSSITTERVATARDLLTAQLDAAREAGSPRPLVDAPILSLEALFAHRTRGKEPKNGALKRVRTITESLGNGEPSGLSAADEAQLVENALAELETAFA